MPKTDLHCRLDGSVSLSLLWKEIQDAKVDIKSQFNVSCNSEQDLKYLLRGPSEGHTPATRLRAKRITKAVLQTRPQLERGVHDVCYQFLLPKSDLLL